MGLDCEKETVGAAANRFARQKLQPLYRVVAAKAKRRPSTYTLGEIDFDPTKIRGIDAWAEASWKYRQGFKNVIKNLTIPELLLVVSDMYIDTKNHDDAALAISLINMINERLQEIVNSAG